MVLNRFFSLLFVFVLSCTPLMAANSRFIRGDANNDGSIDISDPSFILAYLYYGGSAPTCLDAADANDDGSVAMSDAVFINDYLWHAGPAPYAPFPACGVDPSNDALSCISHICQSPFKRGDVNRDNAVSNADLILLASYLNNPGNPGPCSKSLDVDDDGDIDNADYTFLNNYLFLGGVSPPPPGSANCGLDPSFDSLVCSPAANCP